MVVDATRDAEKRPAGVARAHVLVPLLTVRATQSVEALMAEWITAHLTLVDTPTSITAGAVSHQESSGMLPRLATAGALE